PSKLDLKTLLGQLEGRLCFGVLNTDMNDEQALEDCQRTSNQHFVVITEPLATEFAGADSLQNYKKNWEIVSKYPLQLIFTKTVPEATRIRASRHADLIDVERGVAFLRSCDG